MSADNGRVVMVSTPLRDGPPHQRATISDVLRSMYTRERILRSMYTPERTRRIGYLPKYDYHLTAAPDPSPRRRFSMLVASFQARRCLIHPECRRHRALSEACLADLGGWGPNSRPVLED